MARLSVAIILGLGGLGLAFLRTKDGYSFDEVFWFWLQFVSRDRHWARGAQPSPSGLPGEATFAVFPWFAKRSRSYERGGIAKDCSEHKSAPGLLIRAAWQRELAAFLYAGHIDGPVGDWSYSRLVRDLYSPKVYFMLAAVMVQNGFFVWDSGTPGDRANLVCVDEELARKRIRTMRIVIPPTNPSV
jgi:hypothetical protein